MPWSTKKPAAADIAPDWLKPYCKRFLQTLADQGYARFTIQTYDRAAALLCGEVARRGLGDGQLVGATLTKVRAAALGRMHPSKHDQRSTASSGSSTLLSTLAWPSERCRRRRRRRHWIACGSNTRATLRDQRGLTDATIYHCVSFLKRFTAFRFGETLGNLNDITPHNIVDFLRKLRGGTAPRDKTGPSHLRNLFRFLFWSGKTKRDVNAGVILHRRAGEILHQS